MNPLLERQTYPCTRCNGTGIWESDGVWDCPDCCGTGRVSETTDQYEARLVRMIEVMASMPRCEHSECCTDKTCEECNIKEAFNKAKEEKG